MDFEYARSVLAPGGAIRVAINLGNPVLAQERNGRLTGVSVALATAFARELQVPLSLEAFDAAGKVFEAIDRGAWDLAFLAIEPKREEKICFSRPYVLIEGTYLVAAESNFQCVEDLDRPSTRIAVGDGAAYDLFLSRTLKHAELVRAPTSNAAVTTFIGSDLDAAAGVRQPLERFADEHPGYRVLGDSFTTIRQAMAVPSHKKAAQAMIETFIAQRIRNGFVAQALKDSGQRDAKVAYF